MKLKPVWGFREDRSAGQNMSDQALAILATRPGWGYPLRNLGRNDDEYTRLCLLLVPGRRLVGLQVGVPPALRRWLVEKLLNVEGLSFLSIDQEK